MIHLWLFLILYTSILAESVPAAIYGGMMLTPFIHKNGKVTTLHGVGCGVPKLLDSKRILIPDFSFDGTAPSVNFIVGVLPTPEEFPRQFPGIVIPHEAGSCAPLRRTRKRSIIITLPKEFNFHTIDWIGLYCKDFNHMFGFIQIPKPAWGLPEPSHELSLQKNVCQSCPTSFSARFLKAIGYYLPQCSVD